jgi:hypothetical protein
MLTLIDMQGLAFDVGAYQDTRERVFDRNIVPIPECLLEKLDNDVDVDVRPLLDAAWNAADWERSLNFSENGRWKPS